MNSLNSNRINYVLSRTAYAAVLPIFCLAMMGVTAAARTSADQKPAQLASAGQIDVQQTPPEHTDAPEAIHRQKSAADQPDAQHAPPENTEAPEAIHRQKSAADQPDAEHATPEHADAQEPTVHEQGVKAEGLIKARSGEKMILQTPENPNLVVELTDTTDVGQVQGMFKARKKDMSMAALIPGLAVKVEGYRFGDRYIAQKVRFKGDDLKRAESIQAGMHETKMQAQQNAEELEKHRAALAAQEEALRKTQEQAAANAAAVAANKAAIDAAVARFGQLDDYYILDEVTVYFANGKVKVDPKYTPQLQALADKAKTVNGYMIEVTGYASSSGSPALNQKLSEDRANSVTNFLIQQSRIPLTRMLAPGAMGETEQVGKAKAAESEAENRRVVVRVLQNKAISGVAE